VVPMRITVGRACALSTAAASYIDDGGSRIGPRARLGSIDRSPVIIRAGRPGRLIVGTASPANYLPRACHARQARHLRISLEGVVTFLVAINEPVCSSGASTPDRRFYDSGGSGYTVN
jgi:hypothetical protein